jgi:hypothetical protein
MVGPTKIFKEMIVKYFLNFMKDSYKLKKLSELQAQ